MFYLLINFFKVQVGGLLGTVRKGGRLGTGDDWERGMVGNGGRLGTGDGWGRGTVGNGGWLGTGDGRGTGDGWGTVR
jgi:hypothetical protein